ncbi:AAA family ATPase [uncultured Draconibacterium sp.]|uniref:AAA family ATPase n=1 Tax=uncultured Draconibacterium sp. TaxID=1573823 RepID=UPI0032180921
MPKIKTLTLNNFKFFHGKEEINLERNNLLLYGENGSGKSTIYWALYTFLQSVFKQDNEIKKYFDRTKNENLVNRFSSDTSESSIVVEFERENHSTYTNQISFNTINTKDGNNIKEAVRASDFLSYKLLSKLYDFSNSEYLNLFPILEQEVLMHINFRTNFTKRDGSAGSVNAQEWWRYIMAGLNPHPKMHEQEYKDFVAIIERFNNEMKYFLNKIIQSSNEYLTTKFKLPIGLFFKYQPCKFNEFKPGTKSRSWLTIPPKIFITTEFDHVKLAPHPKKVIYKPHTFLNEAKLSAIALSIRFAILEEKYLESAAKILVVDDMLISLDMSNRNTVLDIILSNFKEYQIIFMTHDKMLFEMAKQKIKDAGQDNWKLMEMYESEVEGIPRPYIVKSESYFDKAKKYFLLKEYEIAGNFLRKTTEGFCKAFLPRHMQYGSDCSALDLSGLITKCIEYTNDLGIDNRIFTELSNHRRFVLNPTSHDTYDVPKFNSEVGKCLSTVEKVLEIKYEVIIPKTTELNFELSDATDTYTFNIVVHDDMKLIKLDGIVSVLSKGRFNYKMLKNGIQLTEDSDILIKRLYDTIYRTSDKAKNTDFWEEVMLTDDSSKLNILRIY